MEAQSQKGLKVALNITLNRQALAKPKERRHLPHALQCKPRGCLLLFTCEERWTPSGLAGSEQAGEREGDLAYAAAGGLSFIWFTCLHRHGAHILYV